MEDDKEIKKALSNLEALGFDGHYYPTNQKRYHLDVAHMEFVAHFESDKPITCKQQKACLPWLEQLRQYDFHGCGRSAAYTEERRVKLKEAHAELDKLGATQVTNTSQGMIMC